MKKAQKHRCFEMRVCEYLIAEVIIYYKSLSRMLFNSSFPNHCIKLSWKKSDSNKPLPTLSYRTSHQRKGKCTQLFSSRFPATRSSYFHNSLNYPLFTLCFIGQKYFLLVYTALTYYLCGTINMKVYFYIKSTFYKQLFKISSNSYILYTIRSWIFERFVVK